MKVELKKNIYIVLVVRPPLTSNKRNIQFNESESESRSESQTSASLVKEKS